MLYNPVESGHHHLFADLSGNDCLSLISMLSKFPYISSFLRTFIVNGYFILLNEFLYELQSCGFFQAKLN